MRIENLLRHGPAPSENVSSRPPNSSAEELLRAHLAVAFKPRKAPIAGDLAVDPLRGSPQRNAAEALEELATVGGFERWRERVGLARRWIR